MTKNVAGVKQLMSATLVNKSGKKIDTIVNTFGGAFKATNYKLLDEFYTESIAENRTAHYNQTGETITITKLSTWP